MRFFDLVGLGTLILLTACGSDPSRVAPAAPGVSPASDSAIESIHGKWQSECGSSSVSSSRTQYTFNSDGFQRSDMNYTGPSCTTASSKLTFTGTLTKSTTRADSAHIPGLILVNFKVVSENARAYDVSGQQLLHLLFDNLLFPLHQEVTVTEHQLRVGETRYGSLYLDNHQTLQIGTASAGLSTDLETYDFGLGTRDPESRPLLNFLPLIRM